MTGCACLYLILGLGVHDPKIDSNDYTPINPIYKAEAGYETKTGWTVAIEHMSNGFNINRPKSSEASGDGFNSLWIEKRWNITGGKL